MLGKSPRNVWFSFKWQQTLITLKQVQPQYCAQLHRGTNTNTNLDTYIKFNYKYKYRFQYKYKCNAITIPFKVIGPCYMPCNTPRTGLHQKMMEIFILENSHASFFCFSYSCSTLGNNFLFVSVFVFVFVLLFAFVFVLLFAVGVSKMMTASKAVSLQEVGRSITHHNGHSRQTFLELN